MFLSYNYNFDPFFSDVFFSEVSRKKENGNGENLIEFDLPGVKKEDITIEIKDNNVLSVKGKRGKHEYRKHCLLSSNDDKDNIKAKLEDGVLVVTVPEKKEKSKKILIE